MNNGFFLLLLILIFSSYSKDIIQFEFDEIRRGTLTNNEYDYYSLTLPKDLDKDSYLVIELEPSKYLDSISNIVSDPNLYVSMTEKMPSINSNTWKSERFGDETISISPSLLSPQQNIYISVHCNEKCNYILKTQFVKDIPIKENGIYNFIINPKTVTKFSFTTRENFNELYLNIISSTISSFNAYLAKENPSSTNTLVATPIIFNGYRFTINNQDTTNINTKYHLIIDNEDDRHDLTIWLQYDNEKLLVKEADILYDSISENKAHCYYYPIDYFNENKEIIISMNLFNGQGFIHMAGYNPINADSIRLTDKNKDTNYIVIQNKVIRLTKDNFKNFGTFNHNEQNFLNFCFYAEKSTSLSLKVYFIENYKRLQALNIVYAGIVIEDILPKRSLKKYKLEHFNIDQDITLYLEEKYGNPKLYLFMAKPGEENLIINNSDFEKYKRNNQIMEAKHIHNTYNLYLTKELNKCKLNKEIGLYPCYLSAIIECRGDEDCIYSFSFDHSKDPINMEQKKTYSNVISENEFDYYKIVILDESVKNLVIVLMQNTGKALLRLDSFTSESEELNLNEETQNNQFLPNLIKISSEKLKRDNLKGIFNLKVKGLSYASYSLYYYTFNNEENIDQLDHEKVSMKLEKGKIIKDIFMDTHRFKVYMYDSSTIGNKTNLFIGLVETNYINLELFVFKDLNDFSIYDEKIRGYLWKGDLKDYIYIDKNDKNYIENDILYIMIFKKQSFLSEKKEDAYTSFYLGITDENTPLLLHDGVEFKYQLNKEHPSQKFYYYFVDNGEKDQDLQISISLYYGHVSVLFEIENKIYQGKYVFDDSALITIKREDILPYCKTKKECGIQIEVENDATFLHYSSFLISVRNSKNTPIYIKQGNINKRTILTGEDQYFIIDLKPDKEFGAKIAVTFTNGQGEIYARRLLRNEIFQNNIFPDDINYEYMAGYKNMDNGFYLIEIPYRDFEGHSYCQILLTVRGIFPGYFSTKIEYSISVSNSLYEILTDKNYRFFISKGEIGNFHFKVAPNKKRLYITMTNKDKDANMFLSPDQLISNIYQYEWKSIGAYNEYIDLSINDPYFVERGMNDLDGDYYLAIQGIEDTFYNLYISSQDIKIMTIMEGVPGVCSCETENDNCYFRYENLDNVISKIIYDKRILFYTEFTYGSGSLSAKLYKNGNMDEILNDLPSKNNHDVFTDKNNEYLFMEIKKEDPRNSFNSVVVVGVQCKQKSLFDLSAKVLDSNADVSRNDNNYFFLKSDEDNIFYLSSLVGTTSKFVYYINKNENLNFKIKVLLGQAQIHTYTNQTSLYYNFFEALEIVEEGNINSFHHIADFIVNSNIKGKNDYYGKVPKEYGYKNYFYLEIKAIEDSLINININYENEMSQIFLNKEVIGVLNTFNYYAYFDFKSDIDEVIITITSLDKNRQYDVYLKKNVINKNEKTEFGIDNKYSKASSQNYDLKGKTNPLTSAVSLRIKNYPKFLRTEYNILRVLITIDSFYYTTGKKVKILVSPVINDITRIRPEQNMYYYSCIENRKTEKAIFTLKNINKEDNLMIIEISSCKGNFFYTLTDTPPLDSETYTQLLKRKIPSNSYFSNGKSIITVRNLEEKTYYLTLFGAKYDFESIINGNGNIDKEEENKVDVLFYYYTTNEKKYNYLVTQDSLIYESKDNFSLKVFIPEIKKRDTLGKENNVDSMNYTLIVSDQKTDIFYMESTCYLAKLEQSNQISKFVNLQVEYDKNSNAFNIKGLEEGKTYYMNILGKNLNTGEIITYKPLIIVYSGTFKGTKIVLIIILVIVLAIFLYLAFYFYRKYKIKKLQLNFIEENNSGNTFDKKVGKKSNINLDFIKKKYNDLTEDNNGINDI